MLEKIKKRHQNIVSMVLSAQSSKEAVMRSIDPTHQLLSKPCDIEARKLRLSLAFSMSDLLENAAVRSAVNRLRTILSLPTLLQELTNALGSDETSLWQIEQILSKDIAMTTKILQLVNSAFIGARGQESSLRQAVSLIGTETLRTLALSLHVFSQFEHNAGAET